MDPYLCARWSDVRLSLYALVSEAIQVMLPSALRSRIQEDLMDVSQGESGFLSPADSEMHIYAHPHVEREIHVIDITNGNKIITAIEILSPWNKTSGRLNKDYRKKLRDYDNAGVNIVEIDLLRSPGRGNMRITEGDLPLERRTPYLICIGDAQNPGGWDVYPISIRTPLPTIPIPLRPQDQPAMLNLQPLIERVYKAGGHDDIDYAKPLDPALPAEDSQWADNLLRAAGKRA
jgi:hypothetical protein